ncbi:Uncharacterised protein [Candidatus Ornithobacterium hominis]|uniref:Uncharacterized protein n=2 Tax=Candidatus Ornithobacterium hominis TaxID=2497989 RepID=A0A383TWB8_9FLAO|nr:Uncharacterised protein [Candidatus Ornithobacterium hominis]
MKKFILLLFGAGTLSLQAQVGINTEDPKATLDVQGNVIVGETSYTESKHGHSVVVRDNSTGELKVVGNAGQNNSAPINLITFKLKNVKGDWVANYYTGIDSSKFTVVVTEARFYIREGEGTVELSPGSGRVVRYNPEHVYATIEQNQWTLHADFLGGTPISGNGTWEITCLVINNSLIKVLQDVPPSDFKGRSDFNGSTPRGL